MVLRKETIGFTMASVQEEAPRQTGETGRGFRNPLTKGGAFRLAALPILAAFGIAGDVACAPQQTPTFAGGESVPRPAAAGTATPNPDEASLPGKPGPIVLLEPGAIPTSIARQTATARAVNTLPSATPTAEATATTVPGATAETPYRANLPIVGSIPTVTGAENAGKPAEAKPTVTPRPSGGEKTFKNDDLNKLQDKIAKGQASDTEIRKFNLGAAIEEAPAQLDSILSSVNSIAQPLNPRMTQETLQVGKDSMREWIQNAKDALEKNDIDTARKHLAKVSNEIPNLGDPLKSVFVPPELKQQHDPKDKYIKKYRVDPRIRDTYLQVVDLLVGSDSSY